MTENNTDNGRTLEQWREYIGDDPQDAIDGLTADEMEDLYYKLDDWEIDDDSDKVARDAIETPLSMRMMMEGWDVRPSGEVVRPDEST